VVNIRALLDTAGGSMTKINRRDYLKTMGAGIGSFVAIKDFTFLASPQNRRIRQSVIQKQTPRTSTAHTGLLWPSTSEPPNTNAFVTVVFVGLMGFAYNRDHDGWPVCDVGFHHGGGHHVQNFVLFKSKDGQVVETTKLRTGKNMSLKLAADPKGPKFFETDTSSFNRVSGDAHDFRWLPDLHGEDFYPDGPRFKNTYPNHLYVYDGIFYTWKRTEATFNIVDENDIVIKPYGHTALYMAAGIDLPTHDDRVLLEIAQDVPIPLVWEAGVSYRLLLENEAMSFCPDICSPYEGKRNDFHFNRKMLEIGNGPELTLKADPCGAFAYCKKGSDQAPCMGAGYGKSSGLP